MPSSKDYYSILGLSSTPHTRICPDDVRRAYRRALLAAHPDKNRAGAGYSVDEVKEAFSVLGDAAQKAQYDRGWAKRAGERGGQRAEGLVGAELLDLDQFESDGETWTRACRCGAEGGFCIAVEQLEGVAERGEREVLVGCRGCSLWVRVGFEVEEEEEEEEEGEG